MNTKQKHQNESSSIRLSKNVVKRIGYMKKAFSINRRTEYSNESFLVALLDLVETGAPEIWDAYQKYKTLEEELESKVAEKLKGRVDTKQ